MNAEKEAVLFEILTKLTETNSAQSVHNDLIHGILHDLVDEIHRLTIRIDQLERQGTREN